MKIKFLNSTRETESFDEKLISVGREEDNLLQLSSEGISRHHGKIYCNDDDEWFIEDLDSTNGIRLNGTKITSIAKLANNDILDFHQEKIQIFDLVPEKVISVSSSSTDTAKISVSDIIVNDTNGGISLDPIIPADNDHSNIIAINPAVVENDKGPELEKIAEFIQQNTSNLFNNPLTTKKSEKDDISSEKNKFKFSNKLFYVTLVCAVLVIGAFLINILEDKKTAPAAPKNSVDNSPLYLTYIKENISADNVFRFTLTIENGQASFSVDDLKSQLHYGPIIKPISETELAKLKMAIRDSQFMKLKPVPDGVFNSSEREYKELNIVYGQATNNIILKNRPSPREFLDIEEAINIFSENCNMATFSLSPEELKEQSLFHFRMADDKFANYETNLANLKEAIHSFNIVIEYLSGITPEPKMRREAAEKMKRAQSIRERLIRQYRSQYSTMINQEDLSGARAALETLLALYDNNSRDYLLCKERLIKVDQISRDLNRK